MENETLTGIQNQRWAVGCPVGASAAGDAWPRMLMLGDASVFSEPARRIAASLAGEGWPAECCGVRTVSMRQLIRRISSSEIVHIPGVAARQILREALPTLILARFLGKRTVLHFLTPDIETLLEKHRRLLTPVLRLADVTVVGSRHLQKIMARAGFPVRVVTAPVATDGATFRVRKRLQPKILAVTVLETDANVQAAIRAFKLVKQKYPRAEMVIIGEGSQRSSLQELVERGQIAGVEFRGGSDPAGIARAMDECDLLVHAPLADESPSILIKAMAAGLPVVASDADGLLYMVRDRVNALIVPIGDHVGLADAVLELVENEELCIKLSQQGPVEAEKYLWSRVRQDWVNLYNTLRSTS